MAKELRKGLHSCERLESGGMVLRSNKGMGPKHRHQAAPVTSPTLNSEEASRSAARRPTARIVALGAGGGYIAAASAARPTSAVPERCSSARSRRVSGWRNREDK